MIGIAILGAITVLIICSGAVVVVSDFIYDHIERHDHE